MTKSATATRRPGPGRPPVRRQKQTALRRFIESKGLEQFGRMNPHLRALAERAGLSTDAVYRVARGDYNLRLANARALSKATRGKVSVAELMGAA